MLEYSDTFYAFYVQYLPKQRRSVFLSQVSTQVVRSLQIFKVGSEYYKIDPFSNLGPRQNKAIELYCSDPS